MKAHKEIRRLLRRYERSGLTQRKFAMQSGVAYSTFTHWLRRSRAGDFGGDDAGWIEAPLQAAAVPASERDRFLLELSPQMRLHLPATVAPEVIVHILRELRPACSR